MGATHHRPVVNVEQATASSRPFTALPVAAICDALVHLGLALRVAPPGIRPIQPDTNVAGPARPVRHAGSTDLLLEAIDEATEVTVRFAPIRTGTIVELEHPGWEKRRDYAEKRASMKRAGPWCCSAWPRWLPPVVSIMAERLQGGVGSRMAGTLALRSASMRDIPYVLAREADPAASKWIEAWSLEQHQEAMAGGVHYLIAEISKALSDF